MLKKAMVFTLAAAMLVGTPLTASAAPLNSVYSIWDGTGTWDGHDSGSGTGTVTNTDTNTGALIDGNDAKIIGIVLDKQNLNLEKGDKMPLKAEVVLDGRITVKDKNNKDIDITDDVIAEMSKKVKWEVLYLDADGNKDTSKGDPAAKVGLELKLGSSSDRSTVQLNAKQGTEKGKEVTVRATIDSRYYYVKSDGDQNVDVALNTSERPAPYTAETTVYVKEYSDGLAFRDVKETQYEKHTLDLSKNLVRTPATANDTITWSTSNKNIATVTAAGVVTFKKTTNEGVTITAVGEKGANITQEFKVEKGTPASKVEVWADVDNKSQKVTKLTLDLKDNETADVEVKMYAKVDAVVSKTDGKKPAETEEDAKKNGAKFVSKKMDLLDGTVYLAPSKDKKSVEEKTVEITDNIAWTTNKATIATVEGDNYGATITAAAKAIGPAKITAKASSGKAANVNVTVKATLDNLDIGNAPDKLYSGQSVTLTADRDPALNKDAVKWSIAKVKYTDKNGKEKTMANPNASINNKGVLTIKPKLDPKYLDIEVVLETKATKKDGDGNKVPVLSAKAEINVEQSSISGFEIKDDAANTIIADYVTTYKTDGISVKTGKQVIKNKTTSISVPKGKSYTATVTVPEGQTYVGGAETLVWKSKSDKIAKVEPNGDGTAKITAVAAGNTTITVSGVRVEMKANGEVKGARAISATFKVAVKQPTTSITIKTPNVVVKAANKNTNVIFKATQNKGAKETLVWSVAKEGSVSDDSVASVTKKGKVTLKKDKYAAGDKFIVTVKAKDSGVTAKATIQVITPSAAVRVVDEEGETFKSATLELGGKLDLTPEVNVGTKNDPVWLKAGTPSDDGTKTASPVTYSTNKKGIVQIIGDTVYRVGNGQVKITIKTADSKRATLTIN